MATARPVLLPPEWPRFSRFIRLFRRRRGREDRRRVAEILHLYRFRLGVRHVATNFTLRTAEKFGRTRGKMKEEEEGGRAREDDDATNGVATISSSTTCSGSLR